MPRRRMLDFLPGRYERFLPDFFERPLTEERHATCDACAMCPPAVPELPPEAYYSPSVKCCTFHPALPNYLVGGLLADESAQGAEGRRRIQAKIGARVGVTPFGIVPPARYRLLYGHGAAGFGRAESMACPYLDRDRGMCTVWAHREAQCATWFCKHNNGLDGREFWVELHRYIAGIEQTLVAWVLRELGFEAERILAGVSPTEDLDRHDLDDQPPTDGAYAALWGAWQNREAELYRAADELVASLDRSRYAGLAGLQGELTLARLARRHVAITSPTLPDPLVRNPNLRVARAPDGTYLLSGYKNGEPTRLRKSVYDLLEYFDGRRPTDTVRDAIRAASGLRVADSFLVALYQHRIIVDPDATEP